MKILTKKIKKDLIENFDNNVPQFHIDPNFKPVVKLFGGSACTWLLTELNPKSNIAFGLCDLGFGTPELGYVSMDELLALRFPPFGLPIERDLHWEAEKSLLDYASESRSLGFIQA